MTFRVTDVKFAPGADRDIERGLLGYLVVTLNGGLRLDGLTLRRTRAGKLVVSFPRRRGGVRPLDDTARRAIEAAVLGALEQKGGTR